MAYTTDPTTGLPTAPPGSDPGTPTDSAPKPVTNWKPEDDSVAGRIPGLLKTDNPIVQTQVGQAQLQGQARGLQNSTMTVQAGQKAAEASVLPIAQQDASQTFQKNLSAQGATQTAASQGQAIQGQKAVVGIQTASQEKIAGQQIQSQQQMQQSQIEAQNAQLEKSLGSQATLQAAQIAAQKQLQGEQLTAQEKMLVQQLDAAKANLSTQITATGSQQQTQITADQQKAMDTQVSQFSGIYQDAVNQINANQNMPAEARTAALQSVQAQYNSNMQLVQQIFGVKLTWNTTAPETPPPTIPGGQG